MSKPDVSIIIVSFNTRDLTLECLRSVYRSTRSVSFEIILVDNASHDGSAAAIAAEFPGIELIRLEENIGFGRANNLASRTARAEHLLLLNSDTEVMDGAIERLLEFASANPDAGIYGGRTLFADGSLNRSSCWGRLTPWSLLCRATGLSALFRHSVLFDPETYGNWHHDSVREVDIITGCFLLIQRSLWDRLEGFDPLFFMYFEEADLCLRARQTGAHCLFCPDAVIIHHLSASEPTRAGRLNRYLRSKRLYVRKHWSPLVATCAILLIRFRVVTRALATRLLGIVNEDLKKQAATWQEVWRHREEWLTDPPEGSASQTDSPRTLP